MTAKLSNYRYESPRSRGEGLRIGCTRYLPRGVKREDYARKDIFDVWLPIVAPSAALLRSYREDKQKNWQVFARRYRSEMSKTDAKQVIHMLAKLSETTPISVGCFCHEAPCHRFILEELIRDAASASSK